MTTQEALALAKKEGVSLTIWHVRGMMQKGLIGAPRRNSALQWDWTPGNVKQLIRVGREYLSGQPARGRRRAS